VKFKLFKQKYDPTKYDSLLAKGVVVNGNLTYKGSIHINGEVLGNVLPPDVTDTSVTVSGLITGQRVVTNFLVIEAGGVVTADEVTVHQTLIVKKGGRLNGGTITYTDVIFEEGSIIIGTLQLPTAEVQPSQPWPKS